MGRRLTDKQRKIIVNGKLRGDTQKDICAAAGVAQSTVSHLKEGKLRSMLEEASRRNRTKFMQAYDVALDKLIEDQSMKDYIDRRSAREELVRMMISADLHSGALNSEAAQNEAGALNPVPMPELLQRFYKQTERVILEREVQQVNGHVNMNGKPKE